MTFQQNKKTVTPLDDLSLGDGIIGDIEARYNITAASRLGTEISGLGGLKLGLVDLRGGFQKVRDNQVDVLEQLRQQHQEIRKMSVMQSRKSSRVSDVSSSVQQSQKSSSLHEDSKYHGRESAASANLQRRWEMELASKSKRIQELILNERELQQTVQQLRLELQRRQEEIPSKARQVEAEVTQKFDKQIAYYRHETERFISQNTHLKKQLVSRSFEIEQLKRSLNQAEQQLRFREEDFRKGIRNMEEMIQSKEAHYKKIINQLEIGGTLSQPARYYRDYDNFKRQELSRLQNIAAYASRWGRPDYGEQGTEAAFFRRLLDEELSRYRDRLADIDKTLKSKNVEVDRLERTLTLTKTREEEIVKGTEGSLQAKLAEKQDYYTRKLTEKEDAWARRLAEKEQQWQRKHEALELEKKNTIDQFQQSLNQFINMGRHKQAQLDALRSHKQAFQRKNTENENEVRRLMQELQEYKGQVMNERKRSDEYSDIIVNKQHLSQKQEAQLRKQLKAYVDKNELLEKQLEQFRYYMDSEQYNPKQYENEKLRNQLLALENQVKQMRTTLQENQKYIRQLEAALKPVQPRKPNIMQQSEAMSWKVKEEQYVVKISQLESQLKNNLMNNEQEQTIRLLRSKLEDAERNKSSQDRSYQLEIESLKKFIVDAVENPSQQLKQKQAYHTREIERLTLENTQNAESLKLKYKLEMENNIAIQRALEADKATLENRVEESRNQLSALRQTIGRLERDATRREQLRREERVQLETEVKRLTVELESWKRKFEMQVHRLTRVSEQLQRTMTEKYDRDVTALKHINQRLMQESADMLQLQNQNQQLVVANRYLQAEVKEKSQVVDHLWSVKQAQYENVCVQIRKVRALQPI